MQALYSHRSVLLTRNFPGTEQCPAAEMSFTRRGGDQSLTCLLPLFLLALLASQTSAQFTDSTCVLVGGQATVDTDITLDQAYSGKCKDIDCPNSYNSDGCDIASAFDKSCCYVLEGGNCLNACSGGATLDNVVSSWCLDAAVCG